MDLKLKSTINYDFISGSQFEKKISSTLNALHVITIILFVKDNGATFCHEAVVFMNTELLRVVHVIMFITVHVKRLGPAGLANTLMRDIIFFFPFCSHYRY